MELRQLRHFITIMDTGSMAKAAAVLDLTPQAIGRSMQKLESDVGLPLFERQLKSSVPTHYAYALEKHARVLLAQHRAAEEELNAMGSGVVGSMAVAFSGPMTGEIGPLALSRFQAAYPDIQIALSGGHIELLLPQLHQGKLDFIAGIAPQEKHLKDGLVIEELLTAETVLIGRRRHPLAGKKNVSLEEIREFPWILANIKEDEPPAIPMLKRFEEAGVEPPSQLIKNTSTSAALGLLEKADYLVMTVAYAVPLGIAGPYESGSPFAWLDFDCGLPKRAASIMYRDDLMLSEPTKKLIEEIKAVAWDIKQRCLE